MARREGGRNLRGHGIAFDKAVKAFADPFAVEWIDEREAYGEERCNLLGMCGGVILHVTDTQRGERIGFQPGGRSDMSKTDIIARMHRDGTSLRCCPTAPSGRSRTRRCGR